MGIMMITSLNSYTKTMAMAMKWQKKQEDADYTPGNTDPAPVQDAFHKKLDEMRHPRYDGSFQMEGDIEIKLKAGQKLSAQEMLYLKAHDPGTYQKAKIINREREAYEKALASYQTKEEVEQLKASYAEAAVKRINAIRNDPYASREEKRAAFQMEHYKAASLDDAMHQFMESSEYEALPSAAASPDASLKNQSALAGTEDPHARSDSPVDGLTIGSIQEQQAAQARAAKEAAQYEILDPEDRLEEEPDVPEDPEGDACEEGSIMKAILDEEARWAQEEEDEEKTSDPQDTTPAQPGGPSPELGVKQARAAYMAARSYEADTRPAAPAIDIRR